MTTFLNAAETIHRRGAGDPKVQEAFDLFFKARARLQDVHIKAHMDLFNIEAVLGAFEMAGLLGQLRGLGVDEVGRLSAATRRVIARTLEQNIAFPHDADNHILPPKPYEHFVDLLQRIGKSTLGGVSVITFNYDVALDYALRHVPLDIDYSLGKPVPNALPLLKLHGSLNWAQCSKCGEVLPSSIDDYFKNRRILGPAPDEVFHLPITVDLRFLKHCDEECAGDPLIVPPTWNKAQYHGSVARVWRRAAAELSEAENIIVIGYSLPNSDEFFRYFLPLGIIGPNIIRRVIVCDPDPATVQRYEGILSQATRSRLEPYKAKFSDAIYGLINKLGI
jgi:hypothetical protein